MVRNPGQFLQERGVTQVGLLVDAGVVQKALGIKPGDEVITQSLTFVATVEAILDVRARPVIVEVDETLNMSPQSLEEAIIPRTRALIPVHMLGVPAAMDEIMAVALKYSLLVLEDNAQGVGGTCKGKNLGPSGMWGPSALTSARPW